MALFATSEPVIFAAIFVAETLMFINTGPCNAIIANVVQPNLRAAAYAIAIFAVHFLGDIWSPSLIGKVADMFGDPETMAGAFGRVLAVDRRGADAGRRPAAREHRRRPARRRARRSCSRASSCWRAPGTCPREMALMQAKLKAVPGQERLRACLDRDLSGQVGTCQSCETGSVPTCLRDWEKPT